VPTSKSLCVWWPWLRPALIARNEASLSVQLLRIDAHCTGGESKKWSSGSPDQNAPDTAGLYQNMLQGSAASACSRWWRMNSGWPSWSPRRNIELAVVENLLGPWSPNSKSEV